VENPESSRVVSSAQIKVECSSYHHHQVVLKLGSVLKVTVLRSGSVRFVRGKSHISRSGQSKRSAKYSVTAHAQRSWSQLKGSRFLFCSLLISQGLLSRVIKYIWRLKASFSVRSINSRWPAQCRSQRKHSIDCEMSIVGKSSSGLECRARQVS
jgi:hypothetical protein